MNLEYTQPSVFETVILFVLALLPAMFLMFLIYKMDKKEKEPVSLLIKLLFVGVLCAIPATLLEELAGGLVTMIPGMTTAVYAVISAVYIGIIEEGCKFFAMHHFTWCDPDFNYRFDGVVYAVFVSLGFAAIENVMYVSLLGLKTAFLRAVLAVPAHFAFAVYMGSFYGSAKNAEVRGKGSAVKRNLIFAYITAIVFHALYDGCLFLNNDLTGILFVALVILMYIITIVKMRRSAKEDASVFD